MTDVIEPGGQERLTDNVAAERDAFEPEPCTDLWYAVIRTALHDLDSARRLSHRGELSKNEQRMLHEIAENPPEDFFEGPWFREICHYLGLEPAVAWEDLGLEAHGLRRQRTTPYAA